MPDRQTDRPTDRLSGQPNGKFHSRQLFTWAIAFPHKLVPFEQTHPQIKHLIMFGLKIYNYKQNMLSIINAIQKNILDMVTVKEYEYQGYDL